MASNARAHVCWFFVLQFIFLVAVIKHSPVTYGQYTYPEWAIALGWLLALCSILPIPVIACIKIIRQKGTLIEVCLSSLPIDLG